MLAETHRRPLLLLPPPPRHFLRPSPVRSGETVLLPWVVWVVRIAVVAVVVVLLWMLEDLLSMPQDRCCCWWWWALGCVSAFC